MISCFDVAPYTRPVRTVQWEGEGLALSRIAKIDLVEPQKTEKEGYASKGARLDLYVTDDKGVIYDCEVQTSDKKNLPRRT